MTFDEFQAAAIALLGSDQGWQPHISAALGTTTRLIRRWSSSGSVPDWVGPKLDQLRERGVRGAPGSTAPRAHEYEASRIEQFCMHVANGIEMMDAFLSAGFRPSDSGYRTMDRAVALMGQPHIQARIEALRREKDFERADGTAAAFEQSPVTKSWVMNHLEEVVDRCMAAKLWRDPKTGVPITMEGPNGEMCLVGIFAPRESIRALELLGKERGMFVERRVTKEVSDLENMSNEELKAVAEGTHPMILQMMAKIGKKPGGGIGSPPPRGIKPRLVSDDGAA